MRVRHKRCPLVAELTALRALCDAQRDEIAAFGKRSSTAAGTIAWLTKQADDAKAALAEAATVTAHLAKVRDGQADRLTALRAEHEHETATLRRQVLDLTAEVYDLREGDPDSRKLRAAIERAEIAERTAKQDRREVTDLELTQQTRIREATADMRRELAKADAVIALLEARLRKADRDAPAEVHVLPTPPAKERVTW